MVTETSKQSWQEFKDSAARAKSIKLIIETLEISKYPLTGREICVNAQQEGLWKRLKEMERQGLVETADKRRCSVTGKTSLVWKLKD
jgi:hypothetical protein